MTDSAQGFSFKHIALAVFLPSAVFSIGQGAIIPIIPVVAHNLGASIALAGFIAALIMVGELAGDIPSGWIVARVGEQTAMILASIVCIGGLALCIVSPTTWALAAGVFIIGLATAVFALARHAFITTYVPLRYRARASSTLGGLFRIGWFVGPLLSSATIALTGSTHSVFWIFVAACLITIVVLLVLKDPSKAVEATRTRGEPAGSATSERPTPASAPESVRTAPDAAESTNIARTIWRYRRVLVRLGSAITLVGAVRSSRIVIVPLYAVAVGMSDSATAAVIGIAGGLDFTLFYVSGLIMDRFGRLYTAVPSMLGLAAFHVGLVFVSAEPSFVIVTMGLAVANGLGSGLVMTLGADLAPRRSPAPFLGSWRFMNDVGQAAAPLAVSGLTGLFSLAAAAGSMALVGFVGVGLLAIYIPRFVPSVHEPARRD